MQKFIIIMFAFFVMLIATSIDRRFKLYETIDIDDEDVVDADAMISPPDKYSELLQIDQETRKRIAEYMRMNNYKLKAGRQTFIKNKPTYQELISSGFEFEKIY